MAKLTCSTPLVISSSCSSSSISKLHFFNTTTTLPLSLSSTSTSSPSHLPFFLSLPTPRRRPISLKAHAFGKPKPNNKAQQQEVTVVEEEVEEEEELPWIQEKALDLVEFSGSVTQAIPGPRVGRSSLPWLLAVPLVYLGVTFVLAFVKTVKKFNSPKALRRRQVNKNAELIKSIDELFDKGRDEVQLPALQDLIKKTGFSMEEILRKYIRYTLNVKPFNPDLVADLIQLRKASMLSYSDIAEILNEISRRIVKDKGPVVMDPSGYSEKGFKRKLAVQSLFGKVFYLSELPEFCSRDSSLIVKEIFGVTDVDADKLRLTTLSDVGDMEALEKMAEDGSDLGDNSES